MERGEIRLSALAFGVTRQSYEQKGNGKSLNCCLISSLRFTFRIMCNRLENSHFIRRRTHDDDDSCFYANIHPNYFISIARHNVFFLFAKVDSREMWKKCLTKAEKSETERKRKTNKYQQWLGRKKRKRGEQFQGNVNIVIISRLNVNL